MTLDPARGCIASIIDKSTGRELIDSASPYGFGQYLYERFSQKEMDVYMDAYLKVHTRWAIDDFGKPGLPSAEEAPYAAHTAGNCAIQFHRGNASVSAVMSVPAGSEIPHNITLTATLYEDMPYLDVVCLVAEKQADPWPEAGWLCFPVKADTPRFRLGRLGGIVDPASDVVRSANHDVYCLNSGISVLGADGRGAALCPLDAPLVSLERPGLWHYDRNFLPKQPWVFVNLYNNLWSTNFAQWIEGSWTARVRVWPIVDATSPSRSSPKQPPSRQDRLIVDATSPSRSLQTLPQESADASMLNGSCEARTPLAAGFFDGPAGALPPTQRGVEVSRKGIVATAFGPNPDGAGRILRLWEQTGADGPCVVKLPVGCAVETVQPCDLRGRPGGDPIPVRDGAFEVPVGHYAPVSVLFEEETAK